MSNARVWVTLSPRLHRRIIRAAYALGISRSRFLKDAAIEKVNQVEAQHELPADIETDEVETH
ncbi:hypothetical protein [Pseudonocardia sp. N23]|uniref:hypothetical protein n=1 Tax=Pseudonocardia sp. N23 TaxID=1987376 RepID=UPI001145CAA9|nr:hypothetical protein [Pseudonocardia sp. N23]